MEKMLGTEMCIKFESEEISISVDDCSKSDLKEEDEEEVRSSALHVEEAIRKAIVCQQVEAKRCYNGFVPVGNRHHYESLFFF